MMKIQRLAATYLLLFGLASCGSDPYIYDRYDPTQGQTPTPTPAQQTNPSYFRQGQQQPYQQPHPQYQQNPQQYQQPYQYQQPPYPQPYQQQPYQQPNPYQQQGGSRYYSNPYTIPASPYYNHYDADQYYVPPTNLGNDQQNSVTEKHY